MVRNLVLVSVCTVVAAMVGWGAGVVVFLLSNMNGKLAEVVSVGTFVALTFICVALVFRHMLKSHEEPVKAKPGRKK